MNEIDAGCSRKDQLVSSGHLHYSLAAFDYAVESIHESIHMHSSRSIFISDMSHDNRHGNSES